MRRIVAFTVAVVAVAIPTRLLACRCVIMASEQVAFRRATAVFQGTAVAMRTGPTASGYRENIVTFRVERWRKGSGGDSVEVRTGLGGGDCGYPFEVGRPYTVYAYSAPDGLRTSICSMSWAKPAPPPEPGRGAAAPEGDRVASGR